MEELIKRLEEAEEQLKQIWKLLLQIGIILNLQKAEIEDLKQQSKISFGLN